MPGLATAILDRQLPAEPATKGAPDWVHLLPGGVMRGRDGRSYDLADPGGLILAFQANAIDLPVDYEHQNDKPEARLKGPVPAAGWIKELQSRADGIWGRVEWTAQAAELIATKAYRFLSPSILYHPKTFEIMRLKGAGLVHSPNLYLTALASQEAAMPPADDTATADLAATLAALLGLPSDTSPADLLKKLKAALGAPPDPAKFMPVAAVQEMLQTRLAERTFETDARIKAKVESAARDHYITNGMKDWALALCRSDEAAFDDFCARSGPTFAYLFKPAGGRREAVAPERRNLSDLETAICEQLGLKPGSLAD
jgi:phage I-like protein